MIAEELKKELKPLYEKMLSKIKVSKFSTNSCAFCAQWGDNYPDIEEKSGKRILFVGKAPDGWRNNCLDAEQLFDKNGKNNIFNRDDQMVWAENKTQSPFWRVIKQVARKYHSEDHLNHIAWSNLFKISPNDHGGNPGLKLRKLQAEDCISILRKEIKVLSPNYIVMFTGGWENYFLEDFFNTADDESLPEPEAEKFWKGKKEYKTKLYKVPVEGKERIFIVSPHPMGKNEDNHAKVIIDFIEAN